MEFVMEFYNQFKELTVEIGVSEEVQCNHGLANAKDFMGKEPWNLGIIDSLREFVMYASMGDLTHSQIMAYHTLFREFGIGYNPNFACMELTQHLT